jgi:hypothetical protein
MTGRYNARSGAGKLVKCTSYCDTNLQKAIRNAVEIVICSCQPSTSTLYYSTCLTLVHQREYNHNPRTAIIVNKCFITPCDVNNRSCGGPTLETISFFNSTKHVIIMIKIFQTRFNGYFLESINYCFTAAHA